ncbi:uncharacterized protein [Primulina eburnea]|uniref:uncharacterized protein n=1 Tax=Primulina eburnea TaxID=1245227 RepID=UPI003C6C7C64
MGEEDGYTQELLVLQQILIFSFVFITIVSRFYTKFLSIKKCRPHRRRVRHDDPERINAQVNHLRRIIDIGDVQCIVNLRMTRNAFARLCYLLTHVGGLVESRYIRVEEKVAMFLSILAHHKKNRVIGHDYLRSGHTVSTHFHEVLRCVLKLHPLLLVKPDPVTEDCSNETWKFFKSCLGALDGTYVNVQVPNKDKPRYRTRKGTTAVNVLAVCDRNMNFIYALTGWEGSAADARVLRDAIHRKDVLKVPRGTYYLCDNGYANVDGFLTPYRRKRYHMDDWAIGARAPQNFKEYFNSKHCRARNVIERGFGLLKRRWAVLRSPTFYPLQVQNHIILACMLLHNFIRVEMPEDPLEGIDEVTNVTTEAGEEEFIDNIESSPSWDLWRYNLAISMYNN